MWIETERLVLRSAEPSDTEAYLRLWNSPFVQKYNMKALLDFDRAAAEIAEAAKSDRVLFLQRKEDPRMIGMIDFAEDTLRFGVNSCTLSYALREDCSGLGYMTEAVRAALRYAFETLGMDRVAGRVFSENQASLRVLEKLNFVREGMLREAVRGYGGRVYNDVLFSLSRAEFKSESASQMRNGPVTEGERK